MSHSQCCFHYGMPKASGIFFFFKGAHKPASARVPGALLWLYSITAQTEKVVVVGLKLMHDAVD